MHLLVFMTHSLGQPSIHASFLTIKIYIYINRNFYQNVFTVEVINRDNPNFQTTFFSSSSLDLHWFLHKNSNHR